MIQNRFFHIYFLNMDITVPIYIINLKFSVSILNVLHEGRVSQILYLSPSFYFMTKKNGILFVIVFQSKFLHFIKRELWP